jgi:hypothetical protein
VPATIIRRYLVELIAREAPASKGIDPDILQQILDAIGMQDVPVAEIPDRISQLGEAARSRAAEPVLSSKDGAGIEVVIGASRERLGALDTAGARDILQTKIEIARRLAGLER